MKAKRNVVVGATAAQIELAIGATQADREAVRKVLRLAGQEWKKARRAPSLRNGSKGRLSKSNKSKGKHGHAAAPTAARG